MSKDNSSQPVKRRYFSVGNRLTIVTLWLSVITLTATAVSIGYLIGNNVFNVKDGVDGEDGQTPYIGSNGNWWVSDIDLGVKAQGPQGEVTSGSNGIDGQTPYIGTNGNWYIGERDLGVSARGPQGETGTATNGEDGKTPYIGTDGYWYVGETSLGVQAQGPKGETGSGEDGLTPYIGENGDWWIGETDTEVAVYLNSYQLALEDGYTGSYDKWLIDNYNLSWSFGNMVYLIDYENSQIEDMLCNDYIDIQGEELDFMYKNLRNGEYSLNCTELFSSGLIYNRGKINGIVSNDGDNVTASIDSSISLQVGDSNSYKLRCYIEDGRYFISCAVAYKLNTYSPVVDFTLKQYFEVSEEFYKRVLVNVVYYLENDSFLRISERAFPDIDEMSDEMLKRRMIGRYERNILYDSYYYIYDSNLLYEDFYIYYDTDTIDNKCYFRYYTYKLLEKNHYDYSTEYIYRCDYCDYSLDPVTVAADFLNDYTYGFKVDGENAILNIENDPDYANINYFIILFQKCIDSVATCMISGI